MKISIETIPHELQRYKTCGDWVFEPNGDLNINVSAMKDERSEIAVAIHEFFEALACRKARITAEMVDAFDMNYDSLPPYEGYGYKKKFNEPGEDPRAPYHVQHMQAEQIEMMICRMLGITWTAHEENVNKLFKKGKT